MEELVREYKEIASELEQYDCINSRVLELKQKAEDVVGKIMDQDDLWCIKCVLPGSYALFYRYDINDEFELLDTF